MARRKIWVSKDFVDNSGNWRISSLSQVKKRGGKWSPQISGTPFSELVAGPIVPIKNATNQYLAALGPYLTKMYWDGRNNTRPDFTILGRFDSNAAPGTEISDGKADCKGQIFFDTRGKLGPGGVAVIQNQASLFHYSKQTCTLELNLDKDKSFYNGLAWNTDYSRFFIVESDDKTVYGFDYDVNSGNISNRKVLIDFKATNSCAPDGMTIDCSDNLWIACFTFGYVLQVDTNNGSILQTLHIPVTDVTSVAWGGDYFSTLFVTTSRYMLSEEERRKQPLAGSVFAVTGLKFKGVQSNSAEICTVGCRGDGSCPPCDGNPLAIPNAPVEKFDTASCPANGAIYGGNYCQIGWAQVAK
ncbi:unnamed protein product [Bemisia tabaci]|uniref:Regucalcin n=2 Tax=Bemisia tabaci TaxID=7038 RepID=A0A9P0APA7_BEMTA|nr:unnamed protein product [Bemisia tabaci]